MSSRTSHRLTDPFSRNMVFLVFVLVCAALISNLPEIIQFFRGRSEASPKIGNFSYFLFRSVREMVYLCIVLYLAYSFLASKKIYLTLGILRVSLAVAFWGLICAFYSTAFKDLPLAAPVIGLKMFQYTPLLFVGYAVARRQSRYALLRFASYLRWYVAILIVIAVPQTMLGVGSGSPYGARTFGAFAGTNAFAATLVACGAWFLFARMSHEKIYGSRRYGVWIGACFVLALTTGSRMGITLSLVIVALAVQPYFGKKAKVLALAVLPLAVLAVPLVVSALGLTRHSAARSNEARLGKVEHVIQSFENPADLFFGSGLGLYSSSVVVIFGEDRFPGQLGSAHSAYLEIIGGFGIVGLLAYLYAFLVSAQKGASPEMGFFLFLVGVQGIALNPWGGIPFGVLLLFLWGQLLGIGASEAEVEALSGSLERDRASTD